MSYHKRSVCWCFCLLRDKQKLSLIHIFTAEEAKKAAGDLGYPVLVRPSYVLGGQGMRIAVSDEDVEEYIGIINQIAQELSLIHILRYAGNMI